MSATLDAVASKKERPEPSGEQVAAEELVRRAREQGLSLTGPDGRLKQLAKAALEAALDQEMIEHLGRLAGQVDERLAWAGITARVTIAKTRQLRADLTETKAQ